MQLLGELLLDRSNVKVMMRYVSNSKNLQMMMMLLKDNSRSIQFEAFHVFKVQRAFTFTASCNTCVWSGCMHGEILCPCQDVSLTFLFELDTPACMVPAFCHPCALPLEFLRKPTSCACMVQLDDISAGCHEFLCRA